MNTETRIKSAQLRAQWHDLMAQAADVLAERQHLIDSALGLDGGHLARLETLSNADHHRRMATQARKEAAALGAA